MKWFIGVKSTKSKTGCDIEAQGCEACDGDRVGYAATDSGEGACDGDADEDGGLALR